jgi:hypothetical protein
MQYFARLHRIWQDLKVAFVFLTSSMQEMDKEESILLNIEQLLASIRSLPADSADECAYMGLRGAYLGEIWQSELPKDFPVDTSAALEILMSAAPVDRKDTVLQEMTKVLSGLSPSEANTVALELWNLHEASRYLFGSRCNTPATFPFEPKLALEVHGKVCLGLLSCAGTYRTVQVYALGSGVAYALPSTIKQRTNM